MNTGEISKKDFLQINLDGSATKPTTNLKDLPEDLILRMFSMFTAKTLANISLVCKTIKVYASHDIVWQPFAEALFLPEEIKVKPCNLPFKEFCKPAFPQIVGNSENQTFRLGARDPAFIARFNQMPPVNYKLLSSFETKDLLSRRDAITLMEGTHACYNLSIHHVAQTVVGRIKFDIINFTDYLISFNSSRILLINNKLTSLHFTQDNCQILVYISEEKFWVTNRDIDEGTTIQHPWCEMTKIFVMDKEIVRFMFS
jgi:hypothetical protein